MGQNVNIASRFCGVLFPCVEVAESMSDAYEPSLQATSLFNHIKQCSRVEAG
jgi:hypothetical protein